MRTEPFLSLPSSDLPVLIISQLLPSRAILLNTCLPLTHLLPRRAKRGRICAISFLRTDHQPTLLERKQAATVYGMHFVRNPYLLVAGRKQRMVGSKLPCDAGSHYASLATCLRFDFRLFGGARRDEAVTWSETGKKERSRQSQILLLDQKVRRKKAQKRRPNKSG